MTRLAILFYLFTVPLSVLAQSTTGNLEGWVVDKGGVAIVGANVTVMSTVLQGTRGCTTDNIGQFRLQALPPGNYSVRVTQVANSPVTLQDVRIHLGRTTSLGKIELVQRTIESQEIVITENRPLIDSRSTMTGLNIADSRFDLLPIDRSYLTMVVLAPQASPSFYGDGPNIAGATGVENRYFIDGADATDAYRGISGTQLPYNFVREVQIRSGAYEAEHQSSLGGIVNAVTYSGGNEIHGQVFGFFTNNRFSGSPRLSVGEPPKGSFSEYDIGASLGGPIVRDHLWYFAAYNPKFQKEDVPVPGQPNQNDHSTTHMFATKLSWAVNQSNAITLSFVGDPTVREAVGVSWFTGGAAYPNSVLDLNSYLSRNHTGSANLALTGNHLIGENTLLESSLSYVRRITEYNPTGQSEPYWFLDFTNNTQSGTYQRAYDRTTTFHASVRGTVNLKDHILKGGIEYSDLSYNAEKHWESLIKFAEGFDYQTVHLSGMISMRNPSVFFQDSWRVSDRLTLNAGVRWDPQFMIASDGSTAQEILKAVGPRFGILFQPGTIGSQRLTASAGRFFQPLSLNLSAVYHNKETYQWDVIYPQDPRVDTSGGTKYGGSTFYTNVKDLTGQYYDEVTLGYEREIFATTKVGARVVYRNLGQAVNAAKDSMGNMSYGNPGSPPVQEYPRARREYRALELTIERVDPTGFSFQVSYILSRNYGNYEGLSDITYSSQHGGLEVWPNTNNVYLSPVMMNNNLGLLPDDRTHAFKFFCSYPLSFGLTVGASGYWTSGTPLNELGTSTWETGSNVIFLQPRGSAGRSPSIWDANLRFVYDLAGPLETSWRPRLILDVLHLFSQKTDVVIDQQHYWSSDNNGNPTDPNPNYGLPISFQPPMSMRLGVEVGF